MAVCSKCGKEVKGKAKFCPECGTELETSTKKKTNTKAETKKEETKKVENKAEEIGEAVKESVEKILDTEDSTKEYTRKDAKDNLAMALLPYLGVLALIPYFLEKDSKFVRYHAVQGMNLMLVWIAYSVFSSLFSLIKVSRTFYYYGYAWGSVKVTPWWVTTPVWILGLAVGALSVIGIVYVVQGKAKALPLINKLKVFK